MVSAQPLTFLFEKCGIAPCADGCLEACAKRCKGTICLDASLVNSVYQYILNSKKDHISTHGFSKGTAPIAYLEYTFKQNIIDHLKEFFFTHCVVNFLYKSIADHRIAIAGEPVIKHIDLDPEKGAVYIFELTRALPPIRSDWKRLPFRAPTRKNYKDLDRQVEFFLSEEERGAKTNNGTIQSGDWIFFSMILVDEKDKALNSIKNHVWLHLGDDVIDREAFELFIEKKVGDKFVTTNELLQEFNSNTFDIPYRFFIEILECVPASHFSVDQFKKHFKIKTARELHTKLIEVFSFRNDISQRRETVEATLKLILDDYPFNAPGHLVTRAHQLVMKAMQTNPDYHVYKTQPDFKNKVVQLAEKQVKEHIAIDYISHDEAMDAEDDDIVTYLNLTKRPRTKEFIYFDLPSFKAKGHEAPIPHELIRFYARQEKTLNHIINHLTRR